MLYKKIDIIVREMDICQDIKMHVGRILMARGALLDMYFGQCSYYRSQHAMLLL